VPQNAPERSWALAPEGISVSASRLVRNVSIFKMNRSPHSHGLPFR
jgi:hypothetical protein